MSVNQPFFPTYGAGVTLASTNTSASATFRPGNKQLRLVNSGPNLAYVRVSTAAGAAAATAADLALPVTTGTINAYIISIPESADTITHIAPACTASIHIQPGEGF